MIKTTVGALLLSVVTVCFAGAQETSSNCWGNAMTTDAMHRCADQDAREADTQLKKAYQLLLDKAKNQPRVVAKLKAAQRAWIAYRNAQLQAIFPSDKKQFAYGSMFPICYLKIATEMTKQRTSELRRMLEAWGETVGEGPGCDYRTADEG
jgi:uncharacterized protein YecT (DUF1311 family)